MLPWNPPSSLSNSLGPSSDHSSGPNGTMNYTPNGQPHHQQQQQQQQSQLGQQGLGQVGGQPGQQGIGPGQQGGQQQQQQALNLSTVLQYLQTEWRRYERERNEWEIERGEMRARIALLEGERRGIENVKTDLMRRVKMLEFALKQERAKYLSSANANTINLSKDKESTLAGPAPGGIPPSKQAALKGEDRPGSPVGTRSGTSSPRGDEQQTLPDSVAQAQAQAALGHAHRLSLASTGSTSSLNFLNGLVSGAGGAGTIGGPGSNQATGTWGTGSAMSASGTSWAPSLGRDPRVRAKTRDYLKACLQEIGYLTNPSTLNPLPERTASGIARPRKVLPDTAPQSAGSVINSAAPPVPSAASVPTANRPGAPGAAPNAPSRSGTIVSTGAGSPIPGLLSLPNERNDRLPGASPLSNRTDVTPDANLNDAPIAASEPAANVSVSDFGMAPSEKGPNDRLPNGTPLRREANDAAVIGPSSASSSAGSERGTGEGEEADDRLVTAIFKPENLDEWKEKLRVAGMKEKEREEKERLEGLSASGKGEDELASLTLGKAELEDREKVEKERAEEEKAGKEGQKLWKPRKALRNHLDAVRSVAFDKSEGATMLVSGSDDLTVKFWRLSPHMLSPSHREVVSEIEPVATYRGHSAPITSVLVSSSNNRIISGSLDSSIRVWTVPPRDRDTYSSYDASSKVDKLVGHTDAVWDLCEIPLPVRNESLLASASADGTVKVWSLNKVNQGSPLKLSWGAEGTDGEVEEKGKLAPTCLGVVNSDMRKLAVGWNDGSVRLYEIETGKLVLKFKTDEDGDPTKQVNKLVTHPTLPLLITAHEDSSIKFFDVNTGALEHSMVGHLDAVTSLDIDPSGLSLVSGGHDCSIRFWDITQTRSCVQEVTSHRIKSGEGVLDVKFHPTLPFLASAGADGVVKIYG